jgi:hypothetical protein
MYVVDTSNHRIQYFPYGIISTFQNRNIIHFNNLGSYIGTTVAGVTSSYGSSYSQLYNPAAIHLDSNNNMYILDTTNYRVLKWTVGDPLGYVVVGGNGAGSSLTQISTSYGMFMDNQLNIYVSDSGNSRVVKWLSTNTTSGILVFIY